MAKPITCELCGEKVDLTRHGAVRTKTRYGTVHERTGWAHAACVRFRKAVNEGDPVALEIQKEGRQ